MDPLTELLITKYGMPKEKAVAFAAQFYTGDSQYPNDRLRGEAVQMKTDQALDTTNMATGVNNALGQMARGNHELQFYKSQADNDRYERAGGNQPQNSAPVGMPQEDYDRQDYEHRRKYGMLDKYTQETVPGPDWQDAITADYDRMRRSGELVPDRSVMPLADLHNAARAISTRAVNPKYRFGGQ